MNTTSPVTAQGGYQDNNKAIFIIGGLFFVFGFVTWLGSVLIPYLKLACELSNFESYLVTFAFYISYLIMALPAAGILKITGYKNGMFAGLIVMSIGTLLFIPAALSRTYGLFLTGLFVQGTGLAILQTASNPYVTILGPKESAVRRMSIMGICNGIAGIIAPLILGAVALKGTDNIEARISVMNIIQKQEFLDALAQRVILPYIIMAIVLALLAIGVYFSGLPDINTDQQEPEAKSPGETKTSILQFPHLLLGVFTLFLYVGVEVIAADTIINFGKFQGIPLSTAKFFTSFTLCGMLLGYIFGIICVPRYFSQRQALITSSFAGMGLVLLALFVKGQSAVLFIALLGLANSLMWPAIWPLAINGLGRFTKTGSSLLVMAIGGGALLPLLYGHLADLFNPGQAYWMLLPCYAFISFYALKGYKTGLKSHQNDKKLKDEGLVVESQL